MKKKLYVILIIISFFASIGTICAQTPARITNYKMQSEKTYPDGTRICYFEIADGLTKHQKSFVKYQTRSSKKITNMHFYDDDMHTVMFHSPLEWTLDSAVIYFNDVLSRYSEDAYIPADIQEVVKSKPTLSRDEPCSGTLVQPGGCLDAEPFCTSDDFCFASAVNTPGIGSIGCLSSTPNPVWYWMQIETNGNLHIDITQKTYSGYVVDIDFIAWGPFASVTDACQMKTMVSCSSNHGHSIQPSQFPGNIVDCCYCGYGTESFQVNNVQVGEVYLLLLTNYSNQPAEISFARPTGSANTNCRIVAPPVSNNGPLCIGETLQLIAAAPSGTEIPNILYSWTGPNGFSSVDQNPVIPNVTMANAGTYSLTITIGNETSEPETTTVVIGEPSLPTSFSISACHSHSWQGETYTSSGAYTKTLTNSSGCDSVVTMNLTIYPIYNTTRNQTACRAYTWNGTTYTSSGSYPYTYHTFHGCDSIVTLNLTIVPEYSETVTESACGSYLWYGELLTESGIYPKTFISQYGCDSTISLHLTIKSEPSHRIEVTTCESFFWSGTLYTQSGTYEKTFPAHNGCDSTVSLKLELYSTYAGEHDQVSCGPYTWNNITYTTSGSHSQSFIDTKGCDSTVTKHLSIYQPQFVPAYDTGCDRYHWGDKSFTASGTYIQTFEDMHGCDSTVTLYLTMHNSKTHSFTQAGCGSYTWNDTVYNRSGTWRQTLKTVHGCDSIVTMYLTIYNEDDTDTEGVGCDSYTWAGTTYYTSGIYTKTFTDIHGCDSVVHNHISIRSGETFYDNVSTCESYTWGGTTYTTSGVYSHTFTDKYACDSLVILNLIIFEKQEKNIVDHGCSIYTWNGQSYTQSGTYQQTFTDINGCDSVVYLDLTILTGSFHSFADKGCRNYQWNGRTYNQSGTYQQIFHNVNGCDSVATLNLTVYQPQTYNIGMVVCEAYKWYGEIYTETGTYPLMLTDQNGCDSLVMLYLTVRGEETNYVYDTACISYTWNGSVYTSSGVYTKTFDNQYGCDSIVSLDLTIKPINTELLWEEACGKYIWNDQTYTESGTYRQTFENINGCDSIVTLHLTVKPVSESIEHVYTCGSYTWNNQTYTTSGLYTLNLTNIHDCDSTAVLDLHINPGITYSERVIDCYDYFWEGQLYTQSGIFKKTYQDIHGCDSIRELRLELRSTEYYTGNLQGCGEVVWAGQTYTVSDNYTRVFKDIYQCDSIVSMDIYVTPIDSVEISDVGCYIYNWNGVGYTTDGVYTQTFQSALTLCDSVVTLTLSMNGEPEYTEFSDAACDEYTWLGTTYTQSGEYFETFPKYNGCDSIVVLNLEIYYSHDIEIYDTICENHTYNMHGFTINSTGLTGTNTYEHIRTTGFGCDSITTLYLTVAERATENVTFISCGEYQWGNQLLTENGIYEQTFSNIHGCDSAVRLNFTIYPVYEATETYESCGALLLYGVSYTQSISTQLLLKTQDNCDSIINLEITIHPEYNILIDNFVHCGAYNWNGTIYSTNGFHTQYFKTAVGNCDSIVTIDLTVLPKYEDTEIAYTCGEPYFWMGQSYTQSGIYEISYPSSYYCDSVIRLDLTISEHATFPINDTVCEGEIYQENGFYINTFGLGGQIYTETHNEQNIYGCDSIVELRLQVKHSHNMPAENITRCGFYEWNGIIYEASGIYEQTLQNQFDCDSVVKINLTINPIYSNLEPEVVTACNEYTWNGITYYESGEYSYTHTTPFNCDSIVDLHLTIIEKVFATDSVEACVEYIWNGTKYTASGVYEQTLTSNITGCDSVVTNTITIHQEYTHFRVAEGCGEYIWEGTTYTESGTYTKTLTSIHGCDSTVMLNITIKQRPEIGYITGDEHIGLTSGGGTQTREYEVVPAMAWLVYQWDIEGEGWYVEQTENSKCRVYATQAGSGTLRVKGFHNECWSVEREFVITGALGIEDYEDGIGISVYPNPVRHELNIEFEGLEGKTLLEIYDEVGKKLHREEFVISASPHKYRYSVNGFTSGMYMVITTNSGKKYVRKFVVE